MSALAVENPDDKKTLSDILPEANDEETIGALTFKVQQLMYLRLWLDVPMHGQDARTRNQFMKLILPTLQEAEEDRIAKCKELAEKDGEGNAKMIDGVKGQSQFDLSPENKKALEEYLAKAYNEELTIDVLPSNRKLLKATKVLVFDKIGEAEQFGMEEGRVYSDICEAFEKV